MTASTATQFTVERRQGNRSAYWRLDPTTALATPIISPEGLSVDSEDSRLSDDPSSLLMVLADAVEAGDHRLAGTIARRSLSQNMRDLPGIGAERLHAMAISGAVATSTTTVSDLTDVARQLRDAAVMHQIGFGITSARTKPSSLNDSLEAAVARSERLADDLDAVAKGQRVQLAPLVRSLSFFGLLNIARGLARICTFPNGISGLDVAVAAQIRHRVGPARGLRAQLAIIERDPGNTAARNSACACLVDLGLAEDGLDHLAVSLLRPDHFVGNTGRRALRQAGYPHLANLADQIAVEMRLRHPSEPTGHVLLLATEILMGIDRQAQAELSMVGLLRATSATLVFEQRQRYDGAALRSTR